MANTPLRISIPEPCHEDWNRMTPLGNNRRHCDSCDKAVTDFSWMTDREIHQYLAVAGNNLCGRFRRDQLDRPVRAYVKPSTGWRAAAAGAGLLLSAGVNAQTAASAPVTDPAPPYAELSEIINGDVEQEALMKGTFWGRVLDQDGEPLVGATVLVQGTQSGTVADLDGHFSLSVKAGQKLLMTYIGYIDLVITIRPDATGFGDERPDFVLESAAEELSEVVVISYGEIQGKMVTGGAISVVEGTTCSTASGTPLPEAECEMEAEVDPVITIHPNPFTDRLNVEFPAEMAGTLSAQLWHVNGQLIRKWPTQTHEAGKTRIELPLGDAPLIPGHYILRLTDQDGKVTSQIVLHQ
ncbi:MAG: carboxypeptidase-like regulatory domain-containing protein [Lewinella sp.]